MSCEADQPYAHDEWNKSTIKSGMTLSNDNRTVSFSTGGWKNLKGTLKMDSSEGGRYHFRIKIESHENSGSNSLMIGICEHNNNSTSVYSNSGNNCVYNLREGGIWVRGTENKTYGEKMQTGDILGIIIDFDEKKLVFQKNEKVFRTAWSNFTGIFVLSCDLNYKNDRVTIM
ncbi:hypothetical protein M0812_14002 [Anaeramoeba flamelloides]|uniref:B30.2/SPRY domain-containing protein n=1 Tax=Anaeramoeba flamelloides TaxID=1746091 RepID=A0AAV7ZMT5_9EUKA|nr:hypothetical protein M0812_14002 [Anaeramoeba flamelloides]|eukprot:Anaeramoba_flamelloidesa818649_288.p1 GENE.a818649_288~~a818649_288.p1  ORF type:complete len:172 (+),score=26.54 a818649_288:14-529(+)